MFLNSSQRLFSLFIVPLLVIMVGCGGQSGGTKVPISTFDGGLAKDGDFESGTGVWFGNALNTVPEEGNESNTVNFADVTVAGQPFDVNLSQVVPITQGKRYVLSFFAKTNAVAAPRPGDALSARTATTRTIFAGIGLNEAPWTNVVAEVTLTTDWQLFIVTADASIFGSENSRVIFDMGADTGQVFLDEVILEEVGDIPPPTGDGLTNGDFEAEGSWIGNAFNIIDDAGNRVNSANVETAGDAFAVNLSQVLPIEQGKAFKLTFKARTDDSRTIFAGIGLNEDPWTNDTKEVTLTSDWQTFELDLSSADFGSDNSRVIFDMGADTGLVLLDDVVLEEIMSAGDELLSNGSFEDGTTSWIGNAANVPDELLGFDGTKANFANVETAGDAFAVNLSQIVAITEGETYTLTFKAKSDGNRTILAGIGLNEDPFTNTAESVSLTSEWQTFTLTQTATFGSANSRVLFDMGAETGLVLIDDVSLVEVVDFTPPLATLVDGGFEDGSGVWFGNASNIADDGGNLVNSANVATAGQPSDVNLSQVVPIIQGETYTLTFKARTDDARTMLAGIGLNEAPWTSVTESVNLTAVWQTFTLELTANFGSDNSRVLFDMGADTGLVLIDDVTITISDATPPPPPTAEDVTLFADTLASGWVGFEDASGGVAVVTDSDSTYGEVLELTTGGNTVVGIGSRTGDGSTIDTNGYAALEFDLKMVTAPTSGTDVWRLKVENPAAEIGLDPPTLGEWKNYSIPISDLGTPNALDLIMLFADYGANAGAVYRIDNVKLVAGSGGPVVSSTSGGDLVINVADGIDFEGTESQQATWDAFENGDPSAALEFVANPVMVGNTSATVAKVVALAADPCCGKFAGVVTHTVTPFTLDATNALVKIWVYKDKISPIGIKFERFNGDGYGSHGELTATNTLINQWEELTIDFTAQIGLPENTGIDGIAIFVDMVDGRTADSVVYFDNITFNAAGDVTPPTVEDVTLFADALVSGWVGFLDASGSVTQ